MKSLLLLGALTGAALVTGCGTTEPSRAAAPGASQPIAAGVRSASSTVDAVTWPDGGEQGFEFRTFHHRVLTNVRNPVIRDRLPVFLEDALLHYRSAFDRSRLLPEPAERMTSYVMGDRAGWARVTREQLPANRARRYLQIERGGLA